MHYIAEYIRLAQYALSGMSEEEIKRGAKIFNEGEPLTEESIELITEMFLNKEGE